MELDLNSSSEPMFRKASGVCKDAARSAILTIENLKEGERYLIWVTSAKKGKIEKTNCSMLNTFDPFPSLPLRQ